MNTYEIYKLVREELDTPVIYKIEEDCAPNLIYRDFIEVNNIILKVYCDIGIFYNIILEIYTLKPNGEVFTIFYGDVEQEFKPEIGAWCWPMFCAINDLQMKKKAKLDQVEAEKKKKRDEVHDWFVKENGSKVDG